LGLFDLVLFPIVGAAGIVAISSVVKERGSLFGAFAIASLSFMAFALFQTVGLIPSSYWIEGYPPPLGVVLCADSFSLFMVSLFVLMGIIVTLYSLKYMSEDSGLEKYYALLLLLISGLTGVAISGDLFTLFVFWELMCIASYALVAFRKDRWEPIEAGFKYLVMSTIGSLIALYGISILYGMTGTLNIAEIASRMPSSWTVEGYFSIAMIISGFGVTAAIFPFHSWLPDAHPAAPSPISALLSGVVIKAGAYSILRVLFIVLGPARYDFGTMLLILGVATMTVANLLVFPQRDIKRFLAFSSIANVGIIITAAGVAAYVAYHSPADIYVAYLALAGGAFHILNHAIGKGLLFLASGNFIHEIKSRDIVDLEGISKRMPYSGASFSLGALSLGGIPPLAGFWSKLIIILSLLYMSSAPLMMAVAVIMILNSLFSAAYYIWLIQRISFKPVKADGAKEAGPLMLVPVLVLAVLCVAVTLALPYFLEIMNSVANALLG